VHRLPELEVPDLDAVQDQPHREVVGVALRDLSVFPSLQIRSLYDAPDSLEDGVDQLDVEARSEECIQ